MNTFDDVWKNVFSSFFVFLNSRCDKVHVGIDISRFMDREFKRITCEIFKMWRNNASTKKKKTMKRRQGWQEKRKIRERKKKEKRKWITLDDKRKRIETRFMCVCVCMCKQLFTLNEFLTIFTTLNVDKLNPKQFVHELMYT